MSDSQQDRPLDEEKQLPSSFMVSDPMFNDLGYSFFERDVMPNFDIFDDFHPVFPEPEGEPGSAFIPSQMMHRKPK